MIKLFAKLCQKHNIDMKQFCEECPEYVPAVCSLLASNDISIKCKSVITGKEHCLLVVVMFRAVSLDGIIYAELSEIFNK